MMQAEFSHKRSTAYATAHGPEKRISSLLGRPESKNGRSSGDSGHRNSEDAFDKGRTDFLGGVSYGYSLNCYCVRCVHEYAAGWSSAVEEQ
jgi:hypothetical protein